MKRIITAALLAAGLAGCATGFSRGALQERLEGQERHVTDADIREALRLEPQLRFPFRLGVVLFPDSRVTWDEKDWTALLSAVEPLRSAGVVSDVFPVSTAVVAGKAPGDPKSVRLAAARHGADAVLVVTGAAQVDRYLNPLAFLNLTIVGGFVVPGSHRDALVMMRGVMWDVGNGYLYLTVEAEGVGKTIGPTFIIREEWAIDRARARAVAAFRDELARRIASLKGT